MKSKQINGSEYAAGEGALKISHFAIYQSFGPIAAGFAYQFFITAVIGFVEVLVAGFVAKKQNHQFWPNTPAVLRAVAFGLVAIWLTVVPIYAIAQGSGTALFGFMTALSVLPGAVFDRYTFGDRMRCVHWVGILLFLVSAYAILDFPSLSAFLTLPLWVLLAYTFPLAAALNEVLARFASVKGISPTVNTFWVGATQLVVCTVLILVGIGGALPEVTQGAFVTMLVLGFLIWLGHIVKQLAYADNQMIVVKKIIMIGVLMVGVFAYDWLVLSEVPTVGQWFGLGVVFPAMWLVFKS